MNAAPLILYLIASLKSMADRENKRLARIREKQIAEKAGNLGTWGLVHLDGKSRPALTRIRLDLPCYEPLPFFKRKIQAKAAGLQTPENGDTPAVRLGKPSFFRRLCGRFRLRLLRLEINLRPEGAQSRAYIVREIPE